MSLASTNITSKNQDVMFTSADILKFYLPIASTNMIIGVVFNIINSTMTGAVNAAAAVAAFVIAQTMTDLMSTMSINTPNWLTAKVRDRKSYRTAIRNFAPVVAFNVLLMVLAAWTPLGRIMFSGVFRAPPELSDAITSALKICVPMPFVMVLRGCSQSVLMIRKRTYLMFVGIVVRFLSVVAAAPLLMRQSVLQGAQIGAFMWVMSLSVEAICDFLMASRHFHEYPEEPEDGVMAKTREIWAFIIPLMLVGIVQTLGKPIQNLGMSLTTTPALSIAAYSVGWNGAWLLAAFAQDGIRQTVLVFWNNEQEFVAIRKFFLKVALFVAGLIVVLRAGGIWAWFFETVIGADAELARLAQAPMYVFALYPIAICSVELFTGRLLKSGQTSLMGISKGANLLANFAAAHIISSLAPDAGAFVGIGCILSGLFAELGVVYWADRRVQKRLTKSAVAVADAS